MLLDLTALPPRRAPRVVQWIESSQRERRSPKTIAGTLENARIKIGPIANQVGPLFFSSARHAGKAASSSRDLRAVIQRRIFEVEYPADYATRIPTKSADGIAW
jgi:hypothetical protein